MSIDGRLEYSDYMKKSNGAALLVVMAMIMLLQLVVLHAWFIAGLTSDLAEQRKIRCYNFYMTEAIFEAGMRWIEHDFDALYQKAGACPTGCTFEVTRLLQQWFPQAKKRSIALLVRQSDNKKDTATLMYGVILRELGLPICSLRCMLTKLPPTPRIKEPHLVVSYWTFSVDV